MRTARSSLGIFSKNEDNQTDFEICPWEQSAADKQNEGLLDFLGHQPPSVSQGNGGDAAAAAAARRSNYNLLSNEAKIKRLAKAPMLTEKQVVMTSSSSSSGLDNFIRPASR